MKIKQAIGAAVAATAIATSFSAVASAAPQIAPAASNASANVQQASLKQAYPGQIIKGADGRCYQGRMMGGGRGGAKLGWYPVACPPGM